MISSPCIDRELSLRLQAAKVIVARLTCQTAARARPNCKDGIIITANSVDCQRAVRSRCITIPDRIGSLPATNAAK